MSHSRKNSTSSVINRSPNGTDSLSLSFLHKKRHSDSSIDNKTPSPTDSITSIPKLIRKKSGELVKSNLKLNCLQNAGLSKSMPLHQSSTRVFILVKMLMYDTLMNWINQQRSVLVDHQY